MSRSLAELCKTNTNELLAERQRKTLSDLRIPLNKSNDLLVAIHTEMMYADADRKYLLGKILKRLDEADKREQLYHQKLAILEYQIRQALESGV